MIHFYSLYLFVKEFDAVWTFFLKSTFEDTICCFFFCVIYQVSLVFSFTTNWNKVCKYIQNATFRKTTLKKCKFFVFVLNQDLAYGMKKKFYMTTSLMVGRLQMLETFQNLLKWSIFILCTYLSNNFMQFRCFS